MRCQRHVSGVLEVRERRFQVQRRVNCSRLTVCHGHAYGHGYGTACAEAFSPLP